MGEGGGEECHPERRIIRSAEQTRARREDFYTPNRPFSIEAQRWGDIDSATELIRGRTQRKARAPGP